MSFKLSGLGFKSERILPCVVGGFGGGGGGGVGGDGGEGGLGGLGEGPLFLRLRLERVAVVVWRVGRSSL